MDDSFGNDPAGGGGGSYGGGYGGGGDGRGKVDVQDISDFLSRHSQHSSQRAVTGYAPNGLGGVDEYATSPVQYEPIQAQTESDASMTTTSRPPVIFDRGSARSVVSDLTVERQEVLPPDVVEDILLQAQAYNLNTSYLLPCEFFHLTRCNEVFQSDEVEAWIQHILTNHLSRHDLPTTLLCWYCDRDVLFRATDRRDRERNFRYRMYHIMQHIQDEDRTVDEIRPDFILLEHLRQRTLISEETYLAVREYHEAPQTEVLYELGWRPDIYYWQQDRRSAVVHDIPRQERQERRRRQQRRSDQRG